MLPPGVKTTSMQYSRGIPARRLTAVHTAGVPSALEVLPIEALYRVADLSIDISALACTCRLYRAICAEVCPDLLPTLHSHQRAAVRSMMAREAPPVPLPHPFVRALPLNGDDSGIHAYANCASGHLSLDMPPTIHDIQGGLFCDEPGLGKTVTALAVVLKTAGVTPRPPSGSDVRTGVASDPEGLRPVHGSFYMARVDSVVTAARDAATGGAGGSWGESSRGGDPVDGTVARGRRGDRQSRKERAALETPSLMLSPRNRNMLEDLKLVPRSDGALLGGAGVPCAALEPGQHVLGYVTEGEGFVGCAPRNVEHFRDIFLQFCVANNVTPYALSEMPVLKHLLERLRPRGVVKLARAPAAAPAAEGSDNPRTPACPRTPQSVPRGRPARSSASSALVATPAQGADVPRSVMLCRPHASTRVTVQRRECVNWMKTLPHARPVKRARNQSAAAAATAAAAAATDAGLRHSEALLAALGFTAATPAAAPPRKRSDKHGDDAAAAGPEYDPAPPPERPRGRTSAGQSPMYMLPDPMRSSSTHRFDAPALEEALVSTSDAYALVAAHEPVALSPATLVVVPSILVDHWRTEIARHVRPGALRVYYLESGKDADVPAHRLAWDYDVVVTTFTHLSSYGSAVQLRDRNLRHVVLQVASRLPPPRVLHC